MKQILFSCALIAAAPLAACDLQDLQSLKPGAVAEKSAISPAVPQPAAADAAVLPANLPPTEAQKLIEAGKVTVIDIRTPQEYAAGHLEKAALNLDYYAPDFRDLLGKLDKSAAYLIYCRSGKRSGLALAIMKELGFADARDIAGGINAWTGAGYPVVK